MMLLFFNPYYLLSSRNRNKEDEAFDLIELSWRQRGCRHQGHSALTEESTSHYEKEGRKVVREVKW